jgi:hypothetical protein
MNDQNEAKKLLEDLEGTIIADLRTCIKSAREFPTGAKTPLGGLNFALCLLSLVACEVFGYYITGARRHKEAAQCNRVDTGTYIMEFLQRFFPRDSYFKKLHKVLAAYLRNTLVHAFGFSRMSPPRYIDLCIDKDASRQLETCKKDDERVLKLNSISLACQTIEAFDRLKKEVEAGDTGLCASILEADGHPHRLSKGVCNQFDAVYQEAQRKGLVCRRA